LQKLALDLNTTFQKTLVIGNLVTNNIHNKSAVKYQELGGLKVLHDIKRCKEILTDGKIKYLDPSR